MAKKINKIKLPTPKRKNPCRISGEYSSGVSGVSLKKQEAKAEINSFMRNEIGYVFPNQKEALIAKQNKLTKILKDTKRKLNKSKLTPKQKNVLNTRFKKAANDKAKVFNDLKFFDLKRKKAEEFRNILIKDLNRSLKDSFYNMDVERTAQALKEALMIRTGLRFRRITELSMLDINELLNTYKVWFRQREAGINPKDFKGMGKFSYYSKPSFYVVLQNDKSLQGISLNREIQESLNRKSTKKIEYNRRYAENVESLTDFVHMSSIAYFPNENEQPVNKKDLTTVEEVQNFRNIYELQADLMDSRTKYIVPQPIGDIIRRSKTLKGKDSNALDRYNSIISYAVKSGFHLSKDIHEVPVGNKSYYYVTMKTTDKKGVEKYEAFLAPHFLDDNNRVRFYYPKTLDGKLNGAWVSAIKQAQNSQLDLPNVMKEGFRRAQTEKIFNGYNKQGDEIKTKGYAQYTELNLTIDNPLFKPKTIVKSKDDQKVVSLWTTIRELRNLDNDIWQNFQKSAIKTHAMLQKGISKVPLIKKTYMEKYNMTEEQANDAINDIIDALKLEDNIYIDKSGNVQTAITPSMINWSRGIKENHYPTMFTFNDSVIDLIKSYNGIIDEMARLKEQIGQKKHLIKNATTIAEKRKYGGQLIRLKRILTKYEGDGEEIVGLLEIEHDRIELMLGLKTETEVRKVPPQIMGSYVKHRKLYTNRIKAQGEDVLFGGRRSDPDVYPQYINSMVDTQVHNELYASQINSIPYMHPSISNYLLQDLKTAVGRPDIESGGPLIVPVPYYVDYSNERIVKALQTFFPKLTIEKLQSVTSRIQSYISGNALGVSVSLTNNMQSVLGGIVEHGLKGENQVRRILSNDAWANEIVDKGGVLDTVVAVADVFLSTLSGEVDFIDGFVAQRQMALFQLSKTDFVERSTVLKKLFTKLISRPEINLDPNRFDEVIVSLLEGTYDAVNGMAKGQISDDWYNAIKKQTAILGNEDQLKIFVVWGMSAFGIGNTITEAKGLEPYIGMISGEIRMRKLMFIRGVVYYADFVEPELKGNYTHPRALAAGRALVNQTMFQFSSQNFPKMFRGAAGMSIWKFKTYPYLQFQREAEIHLNFINRLKSLPEDVAFAEFKKLLVPSDKMIIPFLGNIIGYNENDVNSFNKGLSYILDVKVETGQSEGSTERLRRLIWSRVIFSMLNTVMEQFNLVRKVKQVTRKLGLGSPNSYIRGGEAVSYSAVLRGLKLLIGTVALGYDDDDNERELYRIFLPVLLNIAVEAHKTGDYFRGGRLVGKVYYDLFNTFGFLEGKLD